MRTLTAHTVVVTITEKKWAETNDAELEAQLEVFDEVFTQFQDELHTRLGDGFVLHCDSE
jgi:hypothetical protein